ncbi:hypothetical protein M3I54_40695 [Paraburkholderia sp. CNPSo 3274]|uniref:hypothetical protein n=1 Tax=Paraburkholderia sp. CNPSo 3274 TaxID=2940932 RepID=UPI0020B73440|nr:hypothetical protein [Paraburkholderia sp. CNPSo 3274]MCP3713131.1 hypothetical protein [Paraburkholderia sp. CNPSo 3274]
MTKMTTLRTLPPAPPRVLSEQWQQTLDELQNLPRGLLEHSESLALALDSLSQHVTRSLTAATLEQQRQTAELRQLQAAVKVQAQETIQAAQTAAERAEESAQALADQAAQTLAELEKAQGMSWIKITAVAGLMAGIVAAALTRFLF